jgi:hypothetical protein
MKVRQTVYASIGDNVFDAALNDIKNNADRLDICSQEPATYTEATSTYTLGNKTSPGFTGPAAGDTSGRKLTVDAISDGSVTGTDTATHVALSDVSETELMVTTALSSSEAVTSGNTFTLTAWDIEIQDPS